MKNFLGIFLALFLLISCGNQQNKTANDNATALDEVSYAETAQADYAAPADMAKRSMSVGSMLQDSNDQQKLIKTANLRYEVYDLDSSLLHISKILKSYKGLVQNERQFDQGNRKFISLSLRVPAENFDVFLEELMNSDGIRKLENKSISSQDVTEQFIDIESRLTTKRQALARYRDILQKAETVADIVSVEDKIRRLQEEIEAQEARLKYLNHQVDMSEVRINIYQVVPSTYIPEKGEGFFPKLLKAIDNGFEGISLVFFWCIRLWPIWILAIILRWIFRKKSKE